MTVFRVNEIYSCLQGEGVNLGTPSMLVRFQGCNLRCSWCDTPHALECRGSSMSLDDLLGTLRSVVGIRHVVFSGGEPTLHPLQLVKEALGSEWSAEVETNGTRIPHRDILGFSVDHYPLFHWNVSPKGRNAGQEWVGESLAHWAELSQEVGQSVSFKFVIRRDFAHNDALEALEFIDANAVPRRQVVFMAEGNSRESQVDLVWLHDLCRESGVRMGLRLHVLLFGSKRGV